MKLIELVEKYRVDSGLAKADMARLFGVPLQNYNNWVYRNSLPKEHYERAQNLISSGSSKEAAIELILQDVKDLTPSQQEEVLRYVRFLKLGAGQPPNK